MSSRSRAMAFSGPANGTPSRKNNSARDTTVSRLDQSAKRPPAPLSNPIRRFFAWSIDLGRAHEMGRDPDTPLAPQRNLENDSSRKVSHDTYIRKNDSSAKSST